MTGLNADPTWLLPHGVDPEIPSVARLYDYYLGGMHNLACDRELADKIYVQIPDIVLMARANRAMLLRAVRHLAKRGVRQFLDIGSGLPTAGAVHEVARKFVRNAPVVYVDNDPTAVATGRAVIDKYNIPSVAMIKGDVRHPAAILEDPALELLDLDTPMCVALSAIMHFVSDGDDPAGIMRAYRERLPRGSYVVFSHGTPQPTEASARVTELYKTSTSPVYARSYHEILQLVDGYEIEVPLQWVPTVCPEEPVDVADGPSTCMYGGVFRVP